MLRHAQPDGDFGPIVLRALDLLVADLLRRRFGVGARGKASRAGAANAPQASSSAGSAESGRSKSRSDGQASPSTPSAHPTEAQPTEAPPTVTRTAPKVPASHVPRAARRVVFERDALGCSWVDAHGVRCGSHAWLEIDHRQPAGKDGSSEPDNLRLLCRGHNQLAAEHEYGREHIERMSRRRREMDPPLPT